MTQLLFRFRDLSCPTGQTIQRHTEIIEKKEFVYWGWWNKGHEKLPTSIIQQLGLNEGAHTVYLFDSAQKKFYSANCTGVETDLGSKLETPDKEHTPSYYVENRYQMWLKFESISEIEEGSIIKEKSYMTFNDLFSDDNHYDIYTDKIIYSGKELAEQNRTMWLIREKHPLDKQHCIQLSNLAELEPRHFDLTFKSSKRNSMLWLSDLHFDDNGNHEFPTSQSTVSEKTLFDVLQTAYFSEENPDIASLLLSGDLTWKGDADEFQLASRLINDLCSANSLDKSWLGVCPGNHDLAFHTDDMGALDPSAIQQNCEQAREAYGNFYSQFFDIQPNEFMSSGRRILFSKTIPVEFVFINSVILQQEKGSFQGHGFIGEQQLEDIEKTMFLTPEKPRNVTRICVMHHHLIPVTLTNAAYSDAKYSTVLDAERLTRWLTKYNFDFLLHGHMHQNFHCVIERNEFTHKANEGAKPNRLNILSLGSSGVKLSHTGESHGNWACQIKFDSDKIRFCYKKISKLATNMDGDYTLEFDYND